MDASSPCRSHRPRARLLACALAALCAACGGGDVPGAGTCSKSSQCMAGEGCDQTGRCVALPCGGCQADEVCQDSGTCAPAQGARCPAAGCPAGYPCNTSGVCSLVCTFDRDCGDPKLVCSPSTGSCAQCIFDSQCASVAGKPRCESASGTCVACLQPIDCTSARYCETTTHLCQTGCKSNNDCNLTNGERCDGATASAPGKCVQCTSDTDCKSFPSAPACDVPSGRCVGCTAAKCPSTSAKTCQYCNEATPRCDPVAQLCVACLPANDDNGRDCGYAVVAGAAKDPHSGKVCDPTARQCIDGCKDDLQCGCPIDTTTSSPTGCIRQHAQNHCDPSLRSMTGVAGFTEGGCVECTQNVHCKCKVKGVTTATNPECDPLWPQLGSLNGARCVRNATTSYGACQEGCDTNADCPSGKRCGPAGTANAHQCVECSCAAGTLSADGTWCTNPLDPNNPLNGGCGRASGGAQKVCDVATLTCRLKRYAETCDSTSECGDTKDPNIGQCIPAQFLCVKHAHAYGIGSPEVYCDPGKLHGRCSIPCNDLQANSCVNGIACPAGNCDTAVSTEGAPGQHCVSSKCNTK